MNTTNRTIVHVVTHEELVPDENGLIFARVTWQSICEECGHHFEQVTDEKVAGFIILETLCHKHRAPAGQAREARQGLTAYLPCNLSMSEASDIV